MRLMRFLVACGVLAAVAVPAAAQVSADALAKLEAKHKANPTSVATSRALGIAYFGSKRYADAYAVLEPARQQDQKDGIIALYAGMSAEEQGHLAVAKDAYATYLRVGRTKSARDAVSKRLAAIQRTELSESAKALVAQERQLASQVAPSKTVAVMPLSCACSDDLKPLGRGVADLMITDLTKARDLTLLERDRVQALLDEIARGQSGQVDQATAARGGHLLQAGSIVTGTITATPQNITLQAPIVQVATSQYAGTSPPVPGTLNQLFDLEKTLVLQVMGNLGVPITNQIRAALDQHPTKNVQAFLAYSRGLQAMDAGRLDEAANFFDNAHSIDPSFGAALQRANDARSARQGASVTTAQIQTAVKSGSEGQVVNAAEHGTVTTGSTQALGNTLSNALAEVNPSTTDVAGRGSQNGTGTRDAASQTTGQDQTTTRTGTVTIVIKRP